LWIRPSSKPVELAVCGIMRSEYLLPVGKWAWLMPNGCDARLGDIRKRHVRSMSMSQSTAAYSAIVAKDRSISERRAATR
jgi:hypothetical protein